MIKYLIKDENNKLLGFANNYLPNTIEYDFSNSIVTLEEYSKNPTVYKLIDNQLVLDEGLQEQEEELRKEEELKKLRSKRESLFKIYIDRSPMFYEELTQEQINELKAWRQSWLDMPEALENGTWEEPEIPQWLR